MLGSQGMGRYSECKQCMLDDDSGEAHLLGHISAGSAASGMG